MSRNSNLSYQPIDPDPLVDAFLNSEKEIFRSVAYPTEVWKEDPCDVETIHGAAREVFDVLLSRAVSPDDSDVVGRILLLLGESGSGKTHLMRAFRTRTHSSGAGYFGYMQMTSQASNYSRYVLRMLIDSLQKPYSPLLNDDEPRGLRRLSNAIAECDGADPRLIAKLRNEELSRVELARLVYGLAVDIVNRSLRDTSVDLVRAMLFLQTQDAHTHGLVIKYLRGESLSKFDQETLAGISPLDGEEDATGLIVGLGRLMWQLHKAALVICVDQMEDMLFDKSEESLAEARFIKALTALKQVSEQLPSAIVVVSCLEDFFDAFRNRLPSSLRDRVMLNPEPITLIATRNRGEVDDMVEAHLSQLLDNEEALRGTEPVPAELLKKVTRLRSRDVLDACRMYRQRCIDSGYLVNYQSDDGTQSLVSAPSVTAIESRWNDFVAAWEEEPSVDDVKLIRLLDRVISNVTCEHSNQLRFETEMSERFLSIISDSNDISRRAAICNKSHLGGGLTRQVRELRESIQSMPHDASPIIIRTTDYRTKTPKSQIAQEYAAVVKSGGFSLTMDDADWRRMAAFLKFQELNNNVPDFDLWRTTMKPLSRIDSLSKLLALDRAPHVPATQPLLSTLKAPAGTESTAPKADPSAVGVDAGAPLPAVGKLFVGRTTSGDQSATIPVESLKTHAAFLGGSGSGKTTAALNLIEQLLLQKVPVLLVDRKGDLAAFASEAVWDTVHEDPQLEVRGHQLRSTVDVALFTPGHSDGCPLSLSIVPDQIHEVPEGEQQIICRSAADALGQIMGYGKSQSARNKLSILIKSIEVLAGRRAPITLATLIHMIYDPDDELVSALGILDPKTCVKVAEDLQMLQINHQHLFPEDCETLNADLLFGRGEWAASDNTRLSIISTKFLGSDENIQFWVAQLLLELNRWCSRHPSDSLQAVVLFDEADIYLPATSKPATKEPLESLLKRGRSAGLGVFLATQSPGDMDYRCRDNITTWMLGRIKEPRALEKIKPVLSSLRTDVTRHLENQDCGQFFLSQSGDVSRVRSQHSFMETRQLSEREILKLATEPVSQEPDFQSP